MRNIGDLASELGRVIPYFQDTMWFGDFDWTGAKSLKLDTIETIKNSVLDFSGIYIIYHKDDGALYVGKSNNIRDRLTSNHQFISKALERGDDVLYVVECEEPINSILEILVIRHLTPLWNHEHNRDARESKAEGGFLFVKYPKSVPLIPPSPTVLNDRSQEMFEYFVQNNPKSTLKSQERFRQKLLRSQR